MRKARLAAFSYRKIRDAGTVPDWQSTLARQRLFSLYGRKMMDSLRGKLALFKAMQRGQGATIQFVRSPVRIAGPDEPPAPREG